MNARSVDPQIRTPVCAQAQIDAAADSARRVCQTFASRPPRLEGKILYRTAALDGFDAARTRTRERKGGSDGDGQTAK